MAKSKILLSVTLFATLSVWSWAASHPPNLDKALAAQYEILTSRPSDPMAHNDLGNLLVVADRLGEAESAYRRAKDLDPANPDVRYNLGLLLHQLARFDDSREELFSLIELDPSHAWGHYHLGLVFFEQGDRKKALEYYARSFALDPTLTFARHNPHIIDNELATEALLMSSRYTKPASDRMPRRYGEADRIADLMLESLEEEAKQEMQAASEAGMSDDEAANPTPDPSKVRSRSNASFDAEDDVGSEAPEADYSEGGSGNRSLSNEDLGASRGSDSGSRPVAGYYRPPTQSGNEDGRNSAVERGQSSPESPAVRNRVRRPPVRGQAGNTRGNAVRGGNAGGRAVLPPGVAPANPPAARQRFRPGSSSSARLDLELLPTEESVASENTASRAG